MTSTFFKYGVIACALFASAAFAQQQMRVDAVRPAFHPPGAPGVEFGTRAITPYFQLMAQIMTAAHKVTNAQQAAAFTHNLKAALPRVDATYRSVSAAEDHAAKLAATRKLTRDHIAANGMMKQLLAHEAQFSADSDRIIKLYPPAAAVFDQMQAIHNK